MEVFFRELTQEEISTVGKKAADKVNLTISDNGLTILSTYARNGREAVNMIQIAAGLAIQEDRNFIKEEELEWIIHSSQLTPRMEKKINPQAVDRFSKRSCCTWAQFRLSVRN